jgi:hypothetical protein
MNATEIDLGARLKYNSLVYELVDIGTVISEEFYADGVTFYNDEEAAPVSIGDLLLHVTPYDSLKGFELVEDITTTYSKEAVNKMRELPKGYKLLLVKEKNA